MIFARWGVVCCLLIAAAAMGQTVGDATYSRVNTWSVFGEYSNDSSRILMGSAVNRKIGAVGVEYERRLLHRRLFDLGYAAEWRPAMMESDPAAYYRFINVNSQGTIVNPPTPGYAVDKCLAGTAPAMLPPGVTYPPGDEEYVNTTCGRRQVLEQGLSPLGVRLNARTRHRVQPTLSTRMGVLFASQPVPSRYGGNFNPFFDLGVGLEVYRRGGNSFRMEYVLQHYGNFGTVPGYGGGIDTNPGLDSGLVKLTWAFGRVR